MKEWYTIDDVDQLDTPALVVYPGRVKQNIELVKVMIDDVSRLRPHVKTYKNREVTKMMLDAGITKFKCATIAEAEVLGMCDVPDVLLAYQPVGPKLKRFIKLIKQYPSTRYACLVDNMDAAKEISANAVEDGVVIPVFIDLNIGMDRTGIVINSLEMQNAAAEFYTDLAALPGIKPIGLHAYDGHIHDADVATRIEKCNAAFAQVTAVKINIKNMGLQDPVIIAGGSPTFPIHAKRANVECSPGTYIYWDKGYQTMLQEQLFLPAALVITRVISLPDETKLCLDAGHKSVASENVLNKRIYFLNAPELFMVSHSEEHLVVDAGKAHPYKIGDVFYGLPYHICPSVALYERAIIIENGHVSGEWMNIARDRKIMV